MPIILERITRNLEKARPVVSYKFELNPEETERFLNEFLSGFWFSDKVPEGQEVKTLVTFKMDFYDKKEVEERDAFIEAELQRMKLEAMTG